MIGAPLWHFLHRQERAGTPDPVDAGTAAALAARIDIAAQARLGRSLALWHASAGGCNGCELEMRALDTVFYQLQRYGMRFVDTPRHADVMLVTGPLTRNLATAVERAWDAMPDPKWVVALGDCAVDGGVFKGSYGILGGASIRLPVDLMISGCPPPPARILAGLRALLEANATPPAR